MVNLLILDQFAEKYRRTLEPKFPELFIHAAKSKEEIGDFVEKMEVLLAFRLPDELMKKATRLQWIQSMATGVDYFINLPSLRKEILITSTRGMHGPQMSEMAFLHMLNLTRNYPRMLRNQDRRVWERWPQPLLSGKTVGILGIGVIAEELARKCKAFKMKVYGISKTAREVEGIDRFYGREELPRVAAEIDYLIVLVPYSPETHKIVNAKVLSAMKPTAYLINIARGQVIDEEALIEALKNKKIAGAGLDVFNEEPLPKDHPFWGMENVIVSPHVAGMSDIYAEQLLPIFEENLRRFLKGERRNLINRVEW